MKVFKLIWICFLCIVSIGESQGQTPSLQVENHGIVLKSTDPSSISNPLKGMLVWNDISDSFWYFDGTNWLEVDRLRSEIIDEDGDTGVKAINHSTNADTVQFSLENTKINLFKKGNSLKIHPADGVSNYYIGHDAGLIDAVGSGNIGIGNEALSSSNLPLIEFNIGIGYHALETLGTNAPSDHAYNGNNGIGAYTGSQLELGQRNTFLGYVTGYDMTVGFDNTFIGSGAGKQNTYGDYNVSLGANTVASSNTYTQNGSIKIGRNAGVFDSTDHVLHISNSHVQSLIWGDLQNDSLKINGTLGVSEHVGIDQDNYDHLLNIGSTTGDGLSIGSFEFIEDGGGYTLRTNADLDTNGHLSRDMGTSSNAWDDIYADEFHNISDMRAKENVKDLNYGLDEILSLSTISYILKDDPDRDQKLGLSAQELLTQIPEVVKTHDTTYHEDGTKTREELDRYAVNYIELIPVLIKSIQELKAEIDTLKKNQNK